MGRLRRRARPQDGDNVNWRFIGGKATESPIIARPMLKHHQCSCPLCVKPETKNKDDFSSSSSKRSEALSALNEIFVRASSSDPEVSWFASDFGPGDEHAPTSTRKELARVEDALINAGASRRRSALREKSQRKTLSLALDEQQRGGVNETPARVISPPPELATKTWTVPTVLRKILDHYSGDLEVGRFFSLIHSCSSANAQDALQFRGCLAKFCELSARQVRRAALENANRGTSASGAAGVLAAVVSAFKARLPSLFHDSCRSLPSGSSEDGLCETHEECYWQLLDDLRSLVYILTDFETE